MKKIVVFLALFLPAAAFFISCNKDSPQSTVNTPLNRPPVADAGDKTITSFTNTVKLSGTASNDPDNNITGYQWSKVSGPSSCTITDPNAKETQVIHLTEGIYQFELKVTDAGGLFDKDTVSVSVTISAATADCKGNIRPQVNAQLIPVSSLSITREKVSVATAGNKIVFAGGYSGSNTSGWHFYSRVDILDIVTNTWTTAELSQARWGMATAVLGNKIFFAGGVAGVGQYTTRVDIYDVATNTWSKSELSLARVEMAAAAAGNKVVFAGGASGNGFTYTNRVDIYDASAGTWSMASLTDQAVGTAATVIGTKIYFAGNASDWWAWDFGTITPTISIYDASDNTWSTSQLSMSRGYLAGIAVGSKNFWAGGLYKQPQDPFTNQVEIRDMITGASTFECLSQPNAFFSAVLKNNQIVFFTSDVDVPVYWTSNPPVMNRFDIYNIKDNAWSIGILPVNIRSSSIISADNTIYVAGGYVNGVLSNKVWKLEF
ncbi:MAG TPA: kelch repeat-containing protein [Chitinophagaceae bacterium]|nr:kelch repeat-containing protein [Chitinophagaceae bacterium]